MSNLEKFKILSELSINSLNLISKHIEEIEKCEVCVESKRVKQMELMLEYAYFKRINALLGDVIDRSDIST